MAVTYIYVYTAMPLMLSRADYNIHINGERKPHPVNASPVNTDKPTKY